METPTTTHLEEHWPGFRAPARESMDPERIPENANYDVNERGQHDFGFWDNQGSSKSRFFPICVACGCHKPASFGPKDPPLCPDCQDPAPTY
jgi:hypothetical protein